MQIETTSGFHLTPVRMVKISKWWTTRQQMPDGVWKKGNPYPLLEELQTGSVLWESVERITKKLKIILPYDSAVSLFSIFPKNLTSHSVKVAWS